MSSKNTKPTTFASTALCDVLQVHVMATSKQLVTRWMNPESGFSHYGTWQAKKQNDLIRACGLAYRQYRNKTSRNEIIEKLLNNELPLDPEEVKRELDRRSIPHGSGRSTKLALQLLDNMTGTAPNRDDQVRCIEAPAVELLASKGKKQVERLMFDQTDEVCEHLWSNRRQVCQSVIIAT